jgi:hypothetical protein
MWRALVVMASLAGLCVARARADDAADARAVLDNAIKALGGRDKLGKLPATTFNSQGYLQLGDLRLNSKSNWAIQWPDKYRYDGKLTIGDNTNGQVFVGNGKDVWGKAEGVSTEPLKPDEAWMAQQDARAVHLAHRLVPLMEKDYKLSPVGELKVEGRPAVGIKVVHKGQPDLDLYFDKETHLPVKVAFLCKETADDEPAQHAFVFSDYKEADGVKHFTTIRLYRKDKQIMEMNLSNVKRLEKVDASLFETP